MQTLQRHAPQMKEIQKKYKGDKQRQQEELMKFYKENNINPAASCLPLLAQFPVFISLYFVLKHFPKHADRATTSTGCTSSRTSPTRPPPHWSGRCCSPSTRPASSRRRYFMSRDRCDKSQRIMLMVLPVVFIPFIINFPVGLVLYWVTTNLWTVGQGLVTRRLMPKPAAPEKRSSRTPPKEAAATAPAPARRSRRPRPRTPLAAAPGQAQEAAARGDDARRHRQVEATGETVGEAKWAALRELEQLAPGIDKAAVRFQVVSEGERGLLGVGYAPARVVASVGRRGRRRRARAARRSTRATRPREVRDVLEHILDAIGVARRIEIDEDDEA